MMLANIIALILFGGATVVYGMNTKKRQVGLIWAVVGMQVGAWLLARPQADWGLLFPTVIVASGGIAMYMKSVNAIHAQYVVGTLILLGLALNIYSQKSERVVNHDPRIYPREGPTRTPMPTRGSAWGGSALPMSGQVGQPPQVFIDTLQ